MAGYKEKIKEILKIKIPKRINVSRYCLPPSFYPREVVFFKIWWVNLTYSRYWFSYVPF